MHAANILNFKINCRKKNKKQIWLRSVNGYVPDLNGPVGTAGNEDLRMVIVPLNLFNMHVCLRSDHYVATVFKKQNIIFFNKNHSVKTFYPTKATIIPFKKANIKNHLYGAILPHLQKDLVDTETVSFVSDERGLGVLSVAHQDITFIIIQ